MKKTIAVTLDLEADHAGQLFQYGIFKNNMKQIEEVLEILTSLEIKLTVFAVGEIFNLYPEIIKIFEEYNCELEVHSFTHKIVDTDLESEIRNAKEAYRNYFGRPPKGYRAPLGKITDKTCALLEKYGFLYDSSIFPSYYPNPLKYLLRNKSIHYIKGSNLMEIPLTAFTPFRLMLSLSYLKLLGADFYFLLFKIFDLPDTIIFNTHLHDFIFREDSYSKLSFFWKIIYGRNRYKGIEFCTGFLKHVKNNGYSSVFLSELYEENKIP